MITMYVNSSNGKANNNDNDKTVASGKITVLPDDTNDKQQLNVENSDSM